MRLPPYGKGRRLITLTLKASASTGPTARHANKRASGLKWNCNRSRRDRAQDRYRFGWVAGHKFVGSGQFDECQLEGVGLVRALVSKRLGKFRFMNLPRALRQRWDDARPGHQQGRHQAGACDDGGACLVLAPLQPQSELARWYRQRFSEKAGRSRKVGVIALARKLATALWRFLEQGLVSNGAKLKIA
jgi:hypothetical protein